MLTNRYPSLAGKVVLITGGATGIGANLVEAFCAQGAYVGFIDIQDGPANALINALKNRHDTPAPTYRHCDLRNIAELKRSIDELREALGPINVLVNNAANDTRHDFRTVDSDYWDERIQLNLRHYFFAIQATYEDMKQHKGGAIINLGSMSWHACQGGMTGYTTAKAGIEGMTRGLARDLAVDNIRINTLTPGWVMTEKQQAERLDAKALASIEQNQCLKSPLKPESISAMALFLASDDSHMCTAQNFIVDGGWI